MKGFCLELSWTKLDKDRIDLTLHYMKIIKNSLLDELDALWVGLSGVVEASF